MSKLPLFERTVDNIVTDNSKVIAALQAENVELRENIAEWIEHYEAPEKCSISRIQTWGRAVALLAKGESK